MTTDRADGRPLVVDLDRALLRTDPAREAFWAALGDNAPATLRARTPADLEAIAPVRADLLPVNPTALEHCENRQIVVISGAGQALAQAVADALALGVVTLEVIAVTPDRPDRVAVERAVVARYGPAGFDLISGALSSAALKHAAHKVQDASLTTSPRAALREMRPHQWAKNLLLLLPLFAAQSLLSPAIWPVLLAMTAFAAGASSIYVVNDLLDLEVDRRHPQKRYRPIASGALPLRPAMMLSATLALIALGLSAAVSPAVLGLVAVYMLLSLTYSLRLKALRWVDLATLVALYLLRVATGAVAAGIDLSPWLWGFVAAVFLTLAVVKRLTGLARARDHGHLPGRGYSTAQIPAVFALGLSGAALSVLAFLGYSHSAEVTALYSTPWLLRLIAPAVALWLVRMVRLARAGKEDFDPLVFVARDWHGLAIIAVCAVLYGLAL